MDPEAECTIERMRLLVQWFEERDAPPSRRDMYSDFPIGVFMNQCLPHGSHATLFADACGKCPKLAAHRDKFEADKLKRGERPPEEKMRLLVHWFEERDAPPRSRL